MNKKEFFESGIYSPNRYALGKILRQWKCDNHITERCVIHHRDDTEECQKYNEEHYELWGFNEDGTFEYGKYVVFMTLSEHSKHHNIDKEVSDLARQHMGESQKRRFENKKNHPMYGKHHSDETRKKISKANKGAYAGENNPMYGTHRCGEANPMFGKCHSDNARQKMSESISRQMQAASYLYKVYKLNGGTLKWQSFRRALKNDDIIFTDFKISIYTNTK